MTYAALWCKSNFSFLEGASHAEELIEEAQRFGLDALALTDRDGVYGVVRAHEAAREHGVKLIIGTQVTISDGGDGGRVMVLAQDRAGYANLCTLITKGRLRSEKGSCSVSWDEVCSAAGGLLALWPGDSDAPLGQMKDAFGDRLYALAARHRCADEIVAEARLRALAARHAIPVAATVEVLYHTPSRQPLQDVVTCIRHGVDLFHAGRLLKPNAEHALKSPFAFAELFADDPAAVARTREIAGRCTFSLAELRYRYPSERLPDGSTSANHLRRLTYEGAGRRYPTGVPDDVVAQLDKELALVEELDYCGYFLTMRELVEFCRAENILCQGRGSAANSAVCYCLEITAVDPVRMGLLFERFLSRERAEPPDIDLDIEHERREEVIQHVYQKYGRSHAAMVANVIRYRQRSALRDVGKAFGIAENELDRLSKRLSRFDDLAGELDGAGLNPEVREHLLRLTDELYGVPRHLSIHPGGFLLGHDPVSTIVPIENGTMAERTVIQWDKDDVEAIGLFKVDLLGLGALTHLHRCFDLIDEHEGVRHSMATVPPDDPETFADIRRADTVGVFQIESRAQMSMLPRLKPRTFYDLVIEVSIVRPGPITGGMVHPYLRRREGSEPVEYPHPSLIPVLQKTLGVPLFQEQVMRLAIVAADYTPGEADRLRRDMAAWRKTGRMEQHREKLITRMQAKGITVEFAERVFKQICGFGEYGFPESHAASFALVSYVGAWLKCHHHAAFTCALLDAQPMGFYSPATIVEDAKRHGVVVLPIDVNASAWRCSIEAGAVRMGLRYVKGLGAADGARIVAGGPYASFEDFAQRVGETLGARSMRALAEADVFVSLALERRPAMWSIDGLLGARTSDPGTVLALPSDASTEDEPTFEAPSELDRICWDYQRTGHSVHGHPLAPLRPLLREQGIPDARGISESRDGQRVRYAGLVICRQHPGTAGGVTFMTLEDETGFVNLILWKQVFDAYGLYAKTLPLLGVTGKVQRQDGVVHVIAVSLWKPEVALAPGVVTSRDFR